MTTSLRSRLLWFPLLLVMMALMPACALLHAPWKKKGGTPASGAAAKGPQLIGSVYLVSDAPSFVLIDNGSLPPPAVGTVLTINNPGGTAVEMKVTQIRKPPFVVADIVKGAPKKGDPVYQ
jgi:hypothetical protein